MQNFSSQLTRLFLIPCPFSLLLSTFANSTGKNIRNNPPILKHCHLNSGCALGHCILKDDFPIFFYPISIGVFHVGVKRLRLSIHLILQTYLTEMVSNAIDVMVPNATGNECVTFPLTGVASDWPTDIDVYG